MTADSQISNSANERVDMSPFPKEVAADPATGTLDWLLTVILKRVPLGYQDEIGFHYGDESVLSRS